MEDVPDPEDILKCAIILRDITGKEICKSGKYQRSGIGHSGLWNADTNHVNDIIRINKKLSYSASFQGKGNVVPISTALDTQVVGYPSMDHFQSLYAQALRRSDHGVLIKYAILWFQTGVASTSRNRVGHLHSCWCSWHKPESSHVLVFRSYNLLLNAKEV